MNGRLREEVLSQSQDGWERDNDTQNGDIGRVESMGHYLSYYPEDIVLEDNESKEINIVYSVANQNNIECRSLLSLQLIPNMYMHVDTRVNEDIWNTIKEDCIMDLNISKRR